AGPSLTAPPSTSASRPPLTTKSPTRALTPPPPDTPIAGVIAWIEAGTPVDAAGFHSATRDGATTQLGDDVAFTTPSGKTTCMTDAKHSGGALACLVQLADPPPRPQDAYGEWIGGWVDFDGSTIEVGSVHGDPGRFSDGDGPQLAYGDSLSFGDYRCRTDPVGLYCVNYAHQSAVRFSDAGIAPYACAKQVTPPADIGVKFVC
ncbi:MAG: hypothetical protein JWR37_1657, partial [Mycobacterium sp.]|nr:hypothetical protein [Mycobacterium sp.]